MEFSIGLLNKNTKKNRQQRFVLSKREIVQPAQNYNLEMMTSGEINDQVHDLIKKLKRTNTLESIPEEFSPRITIQEKLEPLPPQELPVISELKPKKRGRPKLKDGKKLISFD